MSLEHTVRWSPAHPAFHALVTAFLHEITPVYVVGGVVRDLIAGKRSATNDLDLAIPHSAIPIARRVADRLGWAFYPLDEGRDIARLIFTAGTQPLICDVSRLRGGSIDSDLRLRDFTINAMALALQTAASATAPATSRAPAFSATLVDPTDGAGDIRRRTIRRVSASSIADDPVRMMRAVRFAVDMDFAIDEATSTQILRMPASVRIASPERTRDELWKSFASAQPAAAVEMLRGLGVLPYALPEVAAMDLVGQSSPHDSNVYQHTLMVVRFATALRDWLLGRGLPPTGDRHRDALLRRTLLALEPWSFYLRQHFSTVVTSGHTRAEWLVWHALFHDVGKPETRTVEIEGDVVRTRFLNHEKVGAELTRTRLEALRFSRLEVDSCVEVVASHMRPHHLHASFAGGEISRRARYRYFRDVGGRSLDAPLGVDVLLLAIADYLGTRGDIGDDDWNAWLTHISQMLSFHFSERVLDGMQQNPLVDGRSLMEALALPPGPTIGWLLDELGEAQAAGEIGSRNDAIALARRLVAQRDMG